MFPSRIWREKAQRYRLEAGKCKNCGFVAFPPRLVCPSCKKREWEKVHLPWEGKVISYTVVHTPPAPFSDEAPYVLGIVEVLPGVRLTCQIVDCKVEEIQCGTKVKLEFRCIQRDGEAGVLCYGYKAVPVW